jgi:hypothetical protein
MYKKHKQIFYLFLYCIVTLSFVTNEISYNKTLNGFDRLYYMKKVFSL